MKRRTSPSRLFFIEFLIVLFFFLIVSTVCLKLFVHSHQITAQADTLSHAQTTAASIAGVLTASDGDPELLTAYFDEVRIQDHTAQLYFDDAFQSCPEQDAAYTAAVTFSAENLSEADEARTAVSLSAENTSAEEARTAASDSAKTGHAASAHIRTALITFENMDGKPLYELTVSLHKPLTRGEVLQ